MSASKPAPSPITPRLLSAKRASAELGVPYRTLLDVAHRGELPIVRVSSSLYFERRDLDRWVEARKDAMNPRHPTACGATRTIAGRPDPLACNLDAGHPLPHGVRQSQESPPYVRWPIAWTADDAAMWRDRQTWHKPHVRRPYQTLRMWKAARSTTTDDGRAPSPRPVSTPQRLRCRALASSAAMLPGLESNRRG
jgi:excisionase family DNA binding protein